MRILIIEDNRRLRESLLDYLRDEGFAADAVACGEEGLHRVLHYDYNALVLDVMSPAPDGFEVVRRARATGCLMPVLMLTARASLGDRLYGLDNGADDYLVKPFEMKELVARLRALIRRSASLPNPVIQVGPITLDTAARVAMLNEQPVELTAREFSLMELLALRRNGVVSRREIHDHLFDDRDDSLSNLLDVYIYKLRQKFGKSSILTRRGFGYQLSA